MLPNMINNNRREYKDSHHSAAW